MPYTQMTFAQAKQHVADSLGDTSKVFFTDAEIGRAVNESMRTWNAAAQYWRARGTFNTTLNAGVVDLGPVLDSSGTKLIERTVTDSQIIASVCDALMEPTSAAGIWNGTDKFTMADVLKCLEQACNEFLVRTSCVVLPYTQVVGVVPPVGRLVITDQNVSDLRRVDWLSGADNLRHHLWRIDEWALNAQQRGWSVNAQEPENYAVTSVDPLTVQLAPIPLNGGTFEAQVVKNVTTPTDMGVVLDIPNDFSWCIKWGTLAGLLTLDGQVRDPERSAYCRQRFEEGIAIATGSAASVLQAEINGIPVQVESVMDFDTTRTSWQNETASTPEQLALSGLNLLCIAPKPSAGPHSITMDVIKNAPQLSSDLAFIDIGREYIDVMLDYAQHILSFKMGGAEFAYTNSYLEDMYKVAAQYNAKLRANGQFYDITQGRAQLEKIERPARRELADGSSA